MNIKTFSILSLMVASTMIGCNVQKGGTSVDLNSKADSVAYAIGTSIGGSMKKDGLDSLNLDILKKGLADALSGDSLLLDQMKSQSVIQSYIQERQKVKGDAMLEAGKKFLAENKKKPGVIELPDGLQYTVLKEGTGAIPSATDTVVVHYHGTLIDGTIFDSSVDRGEPAEFAVTGQVIKGWEEALQLMKVGSKWKVFIPASLAWGDRAAGPKIPANSTVLFEMELMSIKGK